MLRNIGIRSKILAVLALPVLVLLLAATVISVGAINDARRAVQVEALAGQAADLTRLVRGLQAERALTMAVLAGDESARPQLEEVRAQVSGGIEQVRGGVGEVNLGLLDEAAGAAVQASQQAHNQVDVLRAQVDGRALSGTLAFTGYTEVIAADVALAGRIGDAVDDRTLAAHLRAYSTTEQLVDLVVTERDLVTPAVAAGVLTPELRSQVQQLISRQDVVREEAGRQAQALGVRLPVTGYTLQMARQKTVQDADGVLENLTVEQWRAAADADVTSLSQAETTLAAAAAERAAVLAEQARSWAWQVGLATALLVVLPVLLALFIARGITRPLRRLTEAAADIRRELPAMVERMQTPGDGPGLQLPEIPVESNDEVGRLAAAFNDVNGTTVQVAQEQAALRGSIAAMFVNVARRDQVLLSRQLAFIDQLERTEENPKTLENLFKLDHLATRMRRNAESLLVLAGIDTGRRLRRPMPLSDVVRTASSEIEHYERVDLVLQADPPMVGHVALTTAHLLAELLENATNFSDPGSRVVVSTAPGPKGIVLTIVDEGLGMSLEELAEANSRIAEPPIAEVVGAQRLGFFVVGRLARRLDAVVTLAAGATSGTVVRIELPASLFSPGSVVELPAADVSEGTGETPVAADAPTSPVAEDSPADLPVPVRGHAIPKLPLPPPFRPSPAAPPTPADAGLPRRGGLPSRVTPPAPVDRPAVPPVVPAPADGLPRRQRPAAVEASATTEAAAPVDAPAVDAPAPSPDGADSTQGAAPRRSGLFSSFRARRPGDAEAAAAPVEAAAQADSESVTDPVTEPVVEVDVPPVAEVSVEPVAEVSVEPVAEEAPAAELERSEVEQSDAERSEVEESAPEPVADATSEVEPEPVVEPVAALEDEPEPVADDEPEPVADVEVEPVTDFEADAGADADVDQVDEPQPAAEVVDVQPEPEPVDAVESPGAPADVPDERPTHRHVAVSELSALAAARPATPAAPPAPAAPEPVEPEPQAAPAGAAALDILPSRSLRKAGKTKAPRGLFGRRKSTPTPPAAPVRPMTRRELHGLEEASSTPDARVPAATGTAPTAAAPAAARRVVAPPSSTSSSTAASSPARSVPGGPLPVRPAPGGPVAAPTGDRPVLPGGHGTATEPVAAPSSLFAIPTQPVPDEAAPPLPTRGGLPGERTGASSAEPASSTAADTPELPAPVPVTEGMADVLRQRSALASEALTELSRLSAYSPAAVETKAPATLSRRTPASTPAAHVAPPRPAPANRRARNAADVRSMLSGFQAGVERGRTSPTEPTTDNARPTGGQA